MKQRRLRVPTPGRGPRLLGAQAQVEGLGRQPAASRLVRALQVPRQPVRVQARAVLDDLEAGTLGLASHSLPAHQLLAQHEPRHVPHQSMPHCSVCVRSSCNPALLLHAAPGAAKRLLLVSRTAWALTTQR